METRKTTFDNLPLMVDELFSLVIKISEKLDKTNNPHEELLTIKDVSSLLNISIPTVHSYASKGLIIKHKIGSRVFFKKNEVLGSLYNHKIAS